VTEGAAAELTVAIGLNKTPTDPGQDPKINYTTSDADGFLAQWVVQKTHGQLATAVVVSSPAFRGFAQDDKNRLMLASVKPGEPLQYLFGAALSEAGEFTTEQAWTDYVAACAARMRSPVTVAVVPTQ